jgi:hypothetical protein
MEPPEEPGRLTSLSPNRQKTSTRARWLFPFCHIAGSPTTEREGRAGLAGVRQNNPVLDEAIGGTDGLHPWSVSFFSSLGGRRATTP